MKKENSIQSDCLDYLRGNRTKGIKGVGGWWLNFHGGDPFMPRGIPDIIGCYHGRVVDFEDAENCRSINGCNLQR